MPRSSLSRIGQTALLSMSLADLSRDMRKAAKDMCRRGMGVWKIGFTCDKLAHRGDLCLPERFPMRRCLCPCM